MSSQRASTSIPWLFAVTAGLEIGTGVTLLITPSASAWLLLGSPIDTPAGLVVGRVLGAALVSIGIACWFARGEVLRRATFGLVLALISYNAATVVLLLFARIGSGLSGVALWPAVILHTALLVWSIRALRVVQHDLVFSPLSETSTFRES